MAQRKTFGCGHKGHGKFCHRCEQGRVLIEKAKKEKDSGKAEKMKAEAIRLAGVPQKTPVGAFES